MEPTTLTAPVHAAPGRRLRAAGDDRLVSGLRRGDDRCFDVIYDRYHRQLLSFCRHMLGSREEAEDALQQVFVAAHGGLLADGRPVDLRPWLYAIARNRCLSMLRARRQTVALEDVPEASGDGLALAAEVEQRQDLKDMLGDLARLPEDQRAALVLAELGDLSHDEIGVALDVRKDKVKALVFQAREQLMGYRQARQADCTEIREQLSTLRGSALRKAPLQRHLAVCPGCTEFKAEVTRQRATLGAVLPVIPAIGLRDQILGAVHAASHSAAAAGAGVAAAGGAVAAGGAGGAGAGAGAGAAAGTAGAGALSGGSGLAAAIGSSGVIAKSIAVVAVVATAGGGAVAVSEHGSGKPAPPAFSVPASAPQGAVSPSAVPGVSGPAGTKTIGGQAANRPGALTGRTNAASAKAAKAARRASNKGTGGKGATTSAAHQSSQAAQHSAAAGAKSTQGATKGKSSSATGQTRRTTNPSATTKTPKRAVRIPAKSKSHVPAVTKTTPVVPPSRGKTVTPTTTSDAVTTPAKGAGGIFGP